MDNGGTLTTTQVVTYALWLAVVGLMAASWITYLSGFPNVALMLAITACPLCGAAMVFNIRGYVCNLSSLIRVVGGLESPGCDIHPFSKG